MTALTAAGIPGIGEIAWGSHVCNFYDSRDDLVETLVPYFKAGLEGNDACLWVTSAPLESDAARTALAAVVPDLAERERAGQIEILDHEAWYLRAGGHDARSTLAGWLRSEEHALRSGYQGLRLTGNTYWLERGDWDSFAEYESLVNEAFRSRRILGLCSYCSARCSARDALDVVANHQFAVARRAGTWQVLESAALELARQDLLRVQRAADALRDADRRKDEFLATLAHELRNPLAPVRSSLEILERAGERPDLAERARATMHRQLAQLERLVDDLLDVARIQSDRLVLRRERVECGSVIQHAVEGCRSQLEAAGVAWSLELPEEALFADADPVRLVQIVGNLLGNACKYTQPGGHVAVRGRRDGDAFVLAVRDDGCGIAPAMLGRVFEMFAQIEPAAGRAQAGLGIGLAIVRRLVDLHGGSVEAHSEGAGAGSEFVVRLPLAAEAGATHAAAAAPAAQRSPAQRRILIVDDNVDAAEALAALLQIHGHDTRVAHDGLAAIEAASEYRPDLVLLDIGLPKLDGHEAARWIRAQPWGREIALVALTGWGQAEDRRRSREVGFDHHLTKPVDLKTLLAAFAQLFDERGPAAG
ncbi:MAG: hypothetical protein DCC71_04590 [Proteobacteria bacterium]|nr:MAG: hypothetical protein DCC71_04590 [Pseudomonadota bacterium]